MGQQINVNIRMDSDIKKEADILFRGFGLNFSTAINAFVRQSLKEKAIPFIIRDVPSHHETLLAEGKAIVKSIQSDSVNNDTDEISLDEINDIISKSRAERRKANT